MYSKSEISVQMCCSKAAVHNVIVKHQAGSSYSNQKKMWMYQKNKPLRWLYHQIHHFMTSTCKKIQAALFESHYRLVNAFQLRFCKPAWKQRLWKLKQKNVWTLEQKNNREISCSLMNPYCRSLLWAKHYARRPPKKRDGEKYTIQTIKHPLTKWFGLYFLDHEWSKISGTVAG